MNDPERPIVDEQLEAYLDGQLDEAARQAFEQRLRDDEELARQVELQMSADESLQRQFPAMAPAEENMQAITDALASRSQAAVDPLSIRFVRRRTLRFAVVAVAAAIGWVAVTVFFNRDGTETPFFEVRPLAQLYQESIDNGFEPYYECREDARFAEMFMRRQGQPLRLLPMPAGSRMTGLSYPGGLSRDTTAVLCRVDEVAVMVFVDRLESDSPQAEDNDDPGIHVFRREKFGLVFYEVTPLDAARMIDFFVESDLQ